VCGQHRRDDQLDQLDEVGFAERSPAAPNPLYVHLVRPFHVLPVDDTTAVAQAWHAENHITGTAAGQRA
jgi:tRNA (Thr-GGU) A37 N-methylase